MAFDSGAFVDAAVASTGLDDFGAGAWRDGLDVYCNALAQCPLNDIGVMAHEMRIAHALAERLRVVDWVRRHPDIAAQPISRPAIVVGLPRTGTTALAHLLAADPDSRALRTWEANAPTPPPETATEHTDPRIAATQAGVDMSHQLMPMLPLMYFATATSPSEALDLTAMSFRCFQFAGQADIPAYEDWLLDCDMQPAYAFQRVVQQLLQWRCPPTRWAWKNPADVFTLEAVRAAFPDAVFIWTHRDPFKALASVCSLVDVVRALGVVDYDRAALGPRQTDIWARGIGRGMASRAALGEEAFVDVWMDDLVRDPIDAIQRLYDGLGWPLTAVAERNMREWLAANPQHGHGDYKPEPARFGLDAAAVRERFAAYIDRFSREE